MGGYVETSQDNGGVHLNSSIPNRAFALACKEAGGKSWETVGPVWYQALLNLRNPSADFAAWAQQTLLAAGQIYGGSSPIYQAVREGWLAVKVVR
jgi:Zn-dependent metalloprotease